MPDNIGESAVHNRCVKHSVMYISLVYERAVQFNTRDFIVETYIRKKLYGMCSRQFRVSFPCDSFPSKSSLFAS
jgi:hypothetical protein